MARVAQSSFGAASTSADYAPNNARITWSTYTRQGQRCFTGLRTRREALRLAAEWDAEFPEAAPYRVERVEWVGGELTPRTRTVERPA